MELTKHIENYKQTLNKTQQKQFDKILDVFEPLRPHTIHKVTKWIETNKTKSETTRANYYRFRDFLYNTCFDVLGYQKTIDNFTNPRSQGCPRFQSGEELANNVGKINTHYSL